MVEGYCNRREERKQLNNYDLSLPRMSFLNTLLTYHVLNDLCCLL